MFRLANTAVKSNNKFLTNVEFKRFLATAAKAKLATTQNEKPKSSKKPVPNKSFMANLFRGQIEPTEMFPYPDVLNEEQKEYIQSFVDPVTRFFVEQNDAAKNDLNECVDPITTDHLWDLGAHGTQAPAEYGGLALTNTQLSRIGEITGHYDLGIGVVLGAHQSIGFKGIMLFGTQEQKDKYLPMVVAGKKYAAFCLTEPSCGSDASAVKCRAVKSADGKHYVLNGSKIWISNGGIAEIFTVFARTDIVNPTTGLVEDKITAFIVERSFGGVVSGPAEHKMGIRCSNTTELFFEDCKIPIENVLGEEGNGFKIAMQILNNGRFGMAGTLSGTMEACIKKATEHANTRVQFGNKLSTYEGIQEKIAKMTMKHYAAQSMAYMVSGNMDSGSTDYHLEAAISKIFSSEAAWYVCDEAIQILGGMGYMRETGLEKVLRDIRIFRIFEGTNDILRLFVALTGIQYAGSHLKELQKAFKNPRANLGFIFQETSKRAIRSVGFGESDLNSFVDPSLKDSAKLCAECIDLFGSTVESLLIKHGKNIIQEQYLLNRLADSAIDIYAMSVVLSRATSSIAKKLHTADYERLMAQAWCVEGSGNVKVNINKISSGQYLDMYKNMSKLSKQVFENDGIAHTNPINVN